MREPALSHWVELADEVVRRHRQGQVLGVDPALVLRGLPPVWRPALDAGGPGDDVVALAGAALARLDRDAVDDRLRAALVEAAAGCVGADLPGLLRRLRPFLPETEPIDGPGLEPPATPFAEAETSAPAPAGSGRTGVRLAVAGAVLAVGLAAIGVAGTGASDMASTGAPLTARPAGVGRTGAAISWDPPHLVVDVDGLRYRYRFDGEVDTVSLRDGAGGPSVTVAAGDRRWEVAVPALANLSGTGAPR